MKGQERSRPSFGKVENQGRVLISSCLMCMWGRVISAVALCPEDASAWGNYARYNIQLS